MVGDDRDVNKEKRKEIFGMQMRWRRIVGCIWPPIVSTGES
jgi:hypothetical protein